MQQVGKAVDHGNIGMSSQIFDGFLGEGSDHYSIQVSGHDLGRIGYGFSPAELGVAGVQENGQSAQLVHSHLEG